MRGTRKFVGTILRSQLIVLLKVGAVCLLYPLKMIAPAVCVYQARTDDEIASPVQHVIACSCERSAASMVRTSHDTLAHSLTIKRIRSAIDD